MKTFPKKLKLTVTLADCEKWREARAIQPCNIACVCPVAQACNRQYSNFGRPIKVGYMNVYFFTSQDTNIAYQMSPILRKYIEQNTSTVLPFHGTFTLTRVD